MRLPDFVNQLRRKLSEARNVAQNPTQALYRWGRKVALEQYEQATLPGRGNPSAQQQPPRGWDILSSRESGRRMASPVSPASRRMPPAEKSVSPSGDTRLQPGDVLSRGWVGRYTVGSCLQDRGWMRLYEGGQDNGGEPVWIFEYLFGEGIFSQDSIYDRQQAFKQIIDLNVRLGEGSDFRILPLRDVITAVAQPCYLIIKALPKSQGLAEYAATQEHPFSPTQVREVLRQVLQSLQYLQAYPVSWPDGSSQLGLPHGKLDLNSLWIRFSEVPHPGTGASFFVYLSRLALWEHLFYPGDPPMQGIAQTTQALGSLSKDFQQLGKMAFVLLTKDHQANPTDLNTWPDQPQARTLYPFVCRLMGVGPEEPFKSPDTAISALKQLPQVPPPLLPPELEPTLTETPSSASDSAHAWRWLGLLVALALLGGGFWLGQRLLRQEPGIVRPPCKESEGCVPTLGAFALNEPIVYGFEPGTYWDRSFFKSLSSPLTTSNPSILLEQYLERRTKVSDQTIRKIAPAPSSREELLTLIQQGRVQAGLIRGDQPLPAGLNEEVVAYDGIAIFVTYSDALREINVPKQIDGQISLTQLQQLFTGQLATLGKNQLPVQLYFPQGYASSRDGAATVQLFRELVFQDPNQRAQFDALYGQVRANLGALPDRPDSIYAHMLQDFETKASNGQAVIGIGFDRISRMHGQCSVYPLALTEGDRTYSVFVGAEGKPININTDLCGDKGAYWVHSDIFDDRDGKTALYPLRYSLAVAYPDTCPTGASLADCSGAGALLARQLRSIEGQYLLSEVGFVPIEPIPRIREFLWSGAHGRQ